MQHTIGLLATGAGAFLVYQAWTGMASGQKAGPEFAKPGPLDPGQPPVVGIPKSILPNGYAECIADGGKWDTKRGVCVWTT